MISQHFWTRGETIMHWQVAHADGNVAGWPHVVVEDGAERTVLFQPEGAPFYIWNLQVGHRAVVGHRLSPSIQSNR